MPVHPVRRAIDGLLAVCRGAPELEYEWDGQRRPLDVVDGPALDEPDEPRQLGIGTAAQYVVVGARGQDRPGYGGRVESQIDVSCQALAWSGEVDMSAARADAMEIVDGMRRILTARPDLDGAVGWARLIGLTYKPLQIGGQGAAAQIELVVRVNATIFDED